jgi:hypothetical protein
MYMMRQQRMQHFSKDCWENSILKRAPQYECGRLNGRRYGQDKGKEERE